MGWLAEWLPMIGVATALAGALGGGFAWLIYAAARSTAGRREQWAALAKAHELTHSPDGWFRAPAIHGTIDDYEIHITLRSERVAAASLTWTQVSVRPPTSLPRGLSMTPRAPLRGVEKLLGASDIEIGEPAVDGRLTTKADSPADVRAWLANPGATEAASHLSGPRDGVRGGWIHVAEAGHLGVRLPELVDRALILARALGEARLRPWHEVAALPGLEWADGDAGTHLVVGEIDGFPVTVAGSAEDGHTLISVGLAPGLPADLSITRGTSDLGDPILDRMIEASGAPPDELRDLIAHDGIREDLLAIVHAYPGSKVTADRVVVSVPSFSDPRLPEIVREAAALTDRLDERVTATRAASPRAKARRQAPKTEP